MVYMFTFNSISFFNDPVFEMGLFAFFLLLISVPLAFWNTGQSNASSWVRVFVCLANLILATQLILRWRESGHFPISNLYESLCFLTLATTLTQLIIEKLYPSPFVAASVKEPEPLCPIPHKLTPISFSLMF